MDHCSLHGAGLGLTSVVPATVLVMSFLGSWHCAGMCGGLVLASCRSTGAHFSYQVGRLVTYLALGLVAGFSGHLLMSVSGSVGALVISVLMGLIFIGMGITMLSNRAPHLSSSKLPACITWVYTGISNLLPTNMPRLSAFMVGALSGFLPCGFLYMMVFATIPLHSPLAAAGMMGVFWLGTLPGLVIGPVVVRKLVKNILPVVSVRFRQALGLVFIVIGLITLVVLR